MPSWGAQMRRTWRGGSRGALRSRTVVWALPGLLCACTSSPSSPGATPGNGGPKSVEVDSQDDSVRAGAQKPDASEASPIDAGHEVDASIDAAEVCVEETVVARPLDADLYIMLDRSASMLESTPSGQTKWDAVRSAIVDFVASSASDGLGMGLQYFPLGAPGVPDHCASDDDCGAQGGPCANKACLPPNVVPPSFTFSSCLEDEDCPQGSPGCVPFGTCSGNASNACFNLGAGGCAAEGDCVAFEGTCKAYASCAAEDYAVPAVPIDALPDNGQALQASLESTEPVGLTPTAAALIGAIQHASARAGADPTRRVVVVLATDGLPTDCFGSGATEVSEAIEVVADAATQGVALGIETYVLGVFSPSETDAVEALGTVARAGGTDHAFVVDPTADPSSALADALADIRAEATRCTLLLPADRDYGELSVELNDPTPLPRVEGAAACDTVELGWYFDADPEQAVPHAVHLCPAACNELRQATNATATLRLDCSAKR